MTTYAWPGWCVNRWQMAIAPNILTFTGPYTPAVQTLDLGGERWKISFDTTPGNSRIAAGEREAFWDRLLGSVNRVQMWNLGRPVPLGTLRLGGQSIPVVNGALAAVSVVNGALQPVTVIGGYPATIAATPAGSNTVTFFAVNGRTLLPGDMLGINGQLVRVVATSTAASGQMTVEFLPRLRNAVPAYTAIVWDRPTATFMLLSDNVPTVLRPVIYEGASVEMIETFI
jgi:hypothetical protein